MSELHVRIFLFDLDLESFVVFLPVKEAAPFVRTSTGRKKMYGASILHCDLIPDYKKLMRYAT